MPVPIRIWPQVDSITSFDLTTIEDAIDHGTYVRYGPNFGDGILGNHQILKFTDVVVVPQVADQQHTSRHLHRLVAANLERREEDQDLAR